MRKQATLSPAARCLKTRQIENEEILECIMNRAATQKVTVFRP